jgi:CO/xanthine dehydrogenase FAD-binding subunit
MSVLTPCSLEDVLEVLDRPAPPDLLAGGTDFMVEVNFGRRRPSGVVALGGVAELRSSSIHAGGAGEPDVLRLGATTTYSDLLAPALAERVPILAQAARTVGSPQIRNAGTVGGNIATASPAGDLLPPLLALEAEVEVVGPAGERTVPLEALLLGPKRTGLAPSEVVRAVRVRLGESGQEFLKVGTRNAMVIAVASVAVVVDREARRVRIALGSVGPTPLRASSAEALAEARLDFGERRFEGGEGTIEEVAEAAAGAASPIDDHRSSAAYRRQAVRVGVARALRRLVASAAGGKGGPS